MVLRRFLVVVYLDTPADLLLVLVRHSVHSKVITIRTPFLLAMIFAQGLSIYILLCLLNADQRLESIFNRGIDTQLTIFAYSAEFDQIFFLVSSLGKNLFLFVP